MLTGREVRDERRMISERRQQLEGVLELLAELDSSLQDQDKALEKFESVQTRLRESDAAQALMRLLTETGTDQESVLETNGKPNVQVYEEIILEHGKPIHAADIVKEAVKRGVVFKGQTPKATQVRNSLVGSKRFDNRGGNMWNVPRAVQESLTPLERRLKNQGEVLLHGTREEITKMAEQIRLVAK